MLKPELHVVLQVQGIDESRTHEFFEGYAGEYERTPISRRATSRMIL